MNYVTIATRGKFVGDFVLQNKPDMTLGNYMEVVYTGPHTTVKVRDFVVYLFPIVIRHSLIHNDAHAVGILTATSPKVAVFLSDQLKVNQTHTLRSVRYTRKDHTWYWPGVDDFELNMDGSVRRRGQ